jgi:hypothetical protein
MGASVFNRLQTQCDVSVASLIAGGEDQHAVAGSVGGLVACSGSPWTPPWRACARRWIPGCSADSGRAEPDDVPDGQRSIAAAAPPIAQVTGADLLRGPFARC